MARRLSTQAEVFADVGLPVVGAAFDGFNSTVFAYGQTGSGKSWSMTGDMSETRRFDVNKLCVVSLSVSCTSADEWRSRRRMKCVL